MIQIILSLFIKRWILNTIVHMLDTNILHSFMGQTLLVQLNRIPFYKLSFLVFTINDFLSIADSLLKLLKEGRAYPVGYDEAWLLGRRSSDYLIWASVNRFLCHQALYHSSYNLVRTKTQKV